jgi:hypothetical protein
MSETKQSVVNDAGFFEKVDAALRQAVAEVIEEHRRSGQPLAVSKDGQVVWLPPDEAVIPSTQEKTHAAY